MHLQVHKTRARFYFLYFRWARRSSWCDGVGQLCRAVAMILFSGTPSKFPGVNPLYCLSGLCFSDPLVSGNTPWYRQSKMGGGGRVSELMCTHERLVRSHRGVLRSPTGQEARYMCQQNIGARHVLKRGEIR